MGKKGLELRSPLQVSMTRPLHDFSAPRCAAMCECSCLRVPLPHNEKGQRGPAHPM